MTALTPQRTAALVGIATVFALVLADPALAQTGATAGGNIGTFVQNVINLLTNNVTRGFAILAIMVTGFAWMFGHMDLRRAGTVIIGIILIFGAATIADLITGATGG